MNVFESFNSNSIEGDTKKSTKYAKIRKMAYFCTLLHAKFRHSYHLTVNMSVNKVIQEGSYMNFFVSLSLGGGIDSSDIK